MKILLVLTSHNVLGDTGKPTGFWLEEFTAPYYAFTDAGAEVTVTSPKGGHPPIDPRSDDPDNQTDTMLRFKKDPATQKVLANSVKLADVKAADYDTIFYAGGHGPMWDLTNDKNSIALIEEFLQRRQAGRRRLSWPLCSAQGDLRGTASRQGKARHLLYQ